MQGYLGFRAAQLSLRSRKTWDQLYVLPTDPAKLVGHYKDALGRTGTAVERDGETLVIDPSNGQLLADIQGNPDAVIIPRRGAPVEDVSARAPRSGLGAGRKAVLG